MARPAINVGGARANPVTLEGPDAYHIPSWAKMNDGQRVGVLRGIVHSYGRDPRVADQAVQILKAAGVQPRDYQGQAAALLAWVQNRVYYVNEPGERIQSPEFTLRRGLGDCFPVGTLVLRDDHELVPIERIEEGERVWGLDGWSTVEATADKGTLPVTEIRLNNGSAFRLTEGHKVYVRSCPLHGPACPDVTAARSNCKDREWTTERIRVSDLLPGMELIAPDAIAFGDDDDVDAALVEGFYVADGWVDGKRFCISGKDGHAKEDQKRRVQYVVESRGARTSWHSRYLRVYDDAWVDRLRLCGSRAPEKRVTTLGRSRTAVAALVEGLLADAGVNATGTVTFSTTSPTLATQFRVLQRMLGVSCGLRLVENHGGLGKHPIYRLSVRRNVRGDGKAPWRLRIQSIERAVDEVPCVDIQTSDHYVYLPEHDVTVSNCDDLSLLLASFYESIRLPWKFVLSGVEKSTKRPVRWIEGTSARPARNVAWTHIYVAVGWPPFNPWGFQFADPSLRGAKLGWDVVGAIERGEKIPVPEMQTPRTGSFSLPPSGMGTLTRSASLPPALSAVLSLSPSAMGDVIAQPSDIGQRINEGIQQVRAELANQLRFERIIALMVVGIVTSGLTALVLRGGKKVLGLRHKVKKNGRRRR